MANLKYLTLEIYSRMDLTAKEALKLREMEISSKEYREIWKRTIFKSKNSEKLLRFISEYDDGYLRPDRCDVYEPIREIFNSKDLSNQISWLSQPYGRVMLKKIKVIKYEGFVENRRFPRHWEERSKTTVPVPNPPDPIFLIEWCLWIDTKILKLKSIDYIKRFFIDLYLVSRGDYGFLTMKEDHKNKNFLVVEEPDGTLEGFRGDNLEQCLPGVYWCNIFGKLYVDWFGKEKFLSLPCYYKEELKDGSYFVQISEDPYYYKNPETKFVDREIIKHLGQRAFFDIHSPNRECIVPDFSKLRK